MKLITDCLDGKQLLWELTKMELRSETMRYSEAKRLQLRTRESDIQNRIEKFDAKL